MITRAAKFVWRAAGRPSPVESDGTPILATGANEPDLCAHCGEPRARFRVDQAISDKFTTIRNAAILWPFATERLCAGCVWAFRSLYVKTGLCFARCPDTVGPGGIYPVALRPIPKPADWPAAKLWPFVRPDALTALLHPPAPPFVAWCPLYGIDHGGEAHCHRTFCPDGEGGVFRPADPLWKLQTKHTLPFAKVSHDARRYDLAVDDTNIAVDVALWTTMRLLCEPLLAELRASGVGSADAREALSTLRAPRGAPLAIAAPEAWSVRVAPLRPHVAARWWAFFVPLLRMPPLTRRS